MSLFGALMAGGGHPGGEDDIYVGSANLMMRQMDTMMSSMMRDPFGGDPFGSMMGGPMMGMGMGMGMMGAPPMRQHAPQMSLMGLMDNNNMNALGLMAPTNHHNVMANHMANPMAMMNSMMSNMDRMTGESSSQMFSSSSMMSMTTGPDGRPQIKMANKTDGAKNHTKFAGGRAQVYQSSSSSHGMPGGVRETKHSVSDSSTGVRKMAIGHHIGDRAHIIERERNRDGEEERQEYLNLDEEEADEFEDEFRQVHGGRRRTAIDGARNRSAAPAISAAAPLAIESGRPAPEHRNDSSSTTQQNANHHSAPRTSTAADTTANDRYSFERVNMPRTSGIDVSKFDRHTSDRSVGLDRLEYHRPNTSYVPAPTSYTRPSSYLPAVSGSSSNNNSGGGRTHCSQNNSRSSRRPGPYNNSQQH